jgi:hypothetical protein
MMSLVVELGYRSYLTSIEYHTECHDDNLSRMIPA